MASPINTGTRDISLKFAQQLTEQVNTEWEQGSFLQKVSPVTQDLLKFWFSSSFCEERSYNFHQGQKQAVLNTIYCHEILKSKSVFELYQSASDSIIDEPFINTLKSDKYKHPKYCIKMATATGKTWVMNALFLWQYLNAKYSDKNDLCKWTKNFLFVAPGLIVYERLLDSFLGKEDENGIRHFETSDLKRNENIFIPETYRNAVYSFIQNNVVRKEEIAKKVTGEGIIAITNWHLLVEDKEEIEDLSVSPLENPSFTVNELMPVTPGKTAGHSLEQLDNNFLKGGELDYLKSLSDICVFNDEAHHIHENKTYGDISDVEWQKSLNYISENKTNEFIQIDFSATPYNVTGSGQRRTKHYFPHIIVDFGLEKAIRQGLVKTIAIDRRKEFASISDNDLNFKSVREGKNVLALSEGQRLMLRAGLQRLKILEEEFGKIKAGKYPKMLVVCEDTKVSPLVEKFFIQEGLQKEDIAIIDSNKKESVDEKEWKKIKQSLFNIDNKISPKIVVSVMMLREGFDVNNICVIVPLRTSQSAILLEQTVGRGLRLMWREPEYTDIKRENIHKLLDLKQEPSGYYDILHIVEHPAFIQFYEDLDKTFIYEEREFKKEKVLGDIITVGLKENYKDYDFYIPQIIRDKEEILTEKELSSKGFDKSPWKLSRLKEIVGKQKGEIFFSQEMMLKTTFGEYRVRVNSDIFTSESYNEFLSKIMISITNNIAKVTARTSKEFPVMQINQAVLLGLIDNYIRYNLFEETFEPMQENNWRILMLQQGEIIKHIMKQVSRAIYELQNNVNVEEAEIVKRYFSEVPELKMRENFSLYISKSIYERTAYPSNKGEFEKNFMLFADADSKVERIIKINENYHTFAHMRYIRTDGMISYYYPDFILKTNDNIYIVETKAQKDISQDNVIQKQKGALDTINKINELSPENRMNCVWHYIILGDTTFEAMSVKGASTEDILQYCELTKEKITRTLF